MAGHMLPSDELAATAPALLPHQQAVILLIWNFSHGLWVLLGALPLIGNLQAHNQCTYVYLCPGCWASPDPDAIVLTASIIPRTTGLPGLPVASPPHWGSHRDWSRESSAPQVSELPAPWLPPLVWNVLLWNLLLHTLRVTGTPPLKRSRHWRSWIANTGSRPVFGSPWGICYPSLLVPAGEKKKIFGSMISLFHAFFVSCTITSFLFFYNSLQNIFKHADLPQQC